MEKPQTSACAGATSLDFPTLGPFPHKQSERTDCWGGAVRGLVVCNVLNIERIRACPRYYRMATLHADMPELWGTVCCDDYRALMLRCAEADGFMAGAIDVRRYPNDGKDVWRNYERVRLAFCPFCGTLTKGAER